MSDPNLKQPTDSAEEPKTKARHNLIDEEFSCLQFSCLPLFNRLEDDLVAMEGKKIEGKKMTEDQSTAPHAITNAVAEGINSKIQAVKRRVGGHRNLEYYETATLFLLRRE